MAMTKGMYSSETPEWATPQDFFDALDDEFCFTLDPCATDENHKCADYFTQADDGLAQPWAPHRVFCNPPYGRVIGHWVKKGWQEAQAGALVVMLIPARTDTAYFQDYALKGEVRFVRGRLYFGDGTGPAPFPSCVVIFRPGQ